MRMPCVEELREFFDEGIGAGMRVVYQLLR